MNLTDDSRFQVNEDCSRDMLAGAGLGKESGEGVIATHELVGGHVAIGLDAMLQAVELPAGIANLAAGLADVDRNALALQGRRAALRLLVRKQTSKGKSGGGGGARFSVRVSHAASESAGRLDFVFVVGCGDHRAVRLGVRSLVGRHVSPLGMQTHPPTHFSLRSGTLCISD